VKKGEDAGTVPAPTEEIDMPQYLIFNGGYLATDRDELTVPTLCDEATRLARLLDALLPDEPEVHGLTALLLLTDARRSARQQPDGSLVPLADQDRSCWDHDLIAEGHRLVRACLRQGRPGSYQLQAAINAVHTDAASAGQTDWTQILALYDQLLAWTPTPVVALNRAVAVAEVRGPAEALALVEELALDRYHLFHATRAELLRRLRRHDEAAAAYDAAIARTGNDVERRHLRDRQSSMPVAGTTGTTA
jgi:RNA polymerase sigma-70 factor, ECF subfamily